MQITALTGGVGGARFLRGLLTHLAQCTDAERRAARLTVIANTGDDITLFGLRVCPDLDTVMYTLGGGVDEHQGWGRSEETHVLQGELAAYGAQPQWFALGDRDLATHIARSQLLGRGMSLSEVTAVLCERWELPERNVRLLPMSNDPVETHVVVEDADGRRAVHFQEWWVRMQAAVPAQQFLSLGIEHATAAPGVLQAIGTADVVLLPPSNPVVSIGTILQVPGVREAMRETAAPVVGVSPIVGGRPVRGHADSCLAALGLDVTAGAVADLYADFLDGWLVDDSAPEDLSSVGHSSVRRSSVGREAGLAVRAVPLLMSDPSAAAALAGNALDLADELQGRRASA